MRLPDKVYADLRKNGVHVSFVDRNVVAWWNRWLGRHDLRHYGGWYWWREGSEDQPAGPFRSKSAAMRDAYSGSHSVSHGGAPGPVCVQSDQGPAQPARRRARAKRAATPTADAVEAPHRR